jgi:molybdate transport system substrate-binding protein
MRGTILKFIWRKSLLLLIFVGVAGAVLAGQSLLVFAGAASKPPTELAAAAFTAKTGVKVDLIFGGSGYVLSQMQLGRTGDVYFPGSSDYMETAKAKGLVVSESERKVVYLVNAINVRKGNPKGIKTLRDLARPGLRVAIANPEGVCVGLYAIEILEKNLKPEAVAAVKANIVNYPESCEKTATSISLATVDAVIGWRVFEHWDPERIETVPLAKEEIIRIGYIPVAISTFSQQPELAQQFIDFVISDEGQQYYRQYKYFTSAEDAAAWIGADKPVGGSWKLPEDWMPR